MAGDSPGRRLKQAIDQGSVMVPGVFSPLVATLAERSGFEAIYLSGAALSASMGLPDVGLLGATEFADAIRAITQCCPLPLLSDADTGFGEALSVERTVRLFESAGAAGLHLEDQEMPKRCGHLSGKTLVDAGAMEAKVRAAVAARHNKDFFVIARTDARGVTGFNDAAERANRYRAAGADMIFPEGLESAEEFATFAQASPGLLLANMTEFGKSPILSFQQLADVGYQLVIYPVTALRVALRSVRRLFEELRSKGHQRDAVPQMLTRAELYDLLGYTGYEERDRKYFGGK